MAQPVHDMGGKICDHCGKVFHKQSFNCTVLRREKGLVIKERVCKDCAHKYFEKGE